jgi:hypothetical protein
LPDPWTEEEALNHLNKYLKTSHNKKRGDALLSTLSEDEQSAAFGLVMASAVRAYLSVLQGNRKRNVHRTRTDVSMEIVGIYMPQSARKNSSVVNQAKSLRRWANHFCTYHEFVKFRGGQHAKTKTVILDNDVRGAIRESFRLKKPQERSPASFKTMCLDVIFTRKDLFPTGGVRYSSVVSVRANVYEDVSPTHPPTLHSDSSS